MGIRMIRRTTASRRMAVLAPMGPLSTSQSVRTTRIAWLSTRSARVEVSASM